MLKCTKASITPVSCKLKNPITSKRSYDIIHKAEKQLLYERVRNMNSTLDMFDKNRSQYYSCVKSMLNEHDEDINKCILFINKTKEHRHSKIKERQIDKFEHLYFKRYGYQHNLNRQAQNIDSIDQDCTWSGHPNVPSSLSNTSPTASSNPAVPATPMAPTPSSGTDPAPMAPNTTPGNPHLSSRDTCKNSDCINKWVINLSKTPLMPQQLSLLQKGPNFGITPKYPPQKPTSQQWNKPLPNFQPRK